MTDTAKFKNVSLCKDSYSKIDTLRKIIVPHTIVSRSQTVNILVNERLKRIEKNRVRGSSTDEK